MTIPTMGITWPSASASASTIITYSYADERFESYLSTQYGGYPELTSTLTATQADLFEQALQAWEAVAAVDFVLVGDTPWTSLRVGLSSIDGRGGTLGVATLWNSGTTTTKSTVEFDLADLATASYTTSSPPVGVVSFYQIALHEIGHVLGLNHSTIYNDIMYPYANRTVTLSTEDITTLVSLYGAPKMPTSSTVQLTPNQTLIQKCYIAYYGRPADAEGLAYWSEQLDKSTGNLSAIINVFANSVEAQGLYGTLSTTQVVTTLYDQLFGRTPEYTGLQYWVTNIDNGTFSRQSVMLQLLDGAQNSDALIINNKLSAASLFSNSFIPGYGTEDIQDIRTWLSGVMTSVPYQEAVTAAITAIGVNLPSSWQYEALS
jgi:hypothetical protein